MPTTATENHWFDAVPYAADGTELACYLDGPADHFRIGCGCGWRSTQRIHTTEKHFMLPETQWEAAEPVWEQMHYIPAVLASHAEELPTLAAATRTAPVAVLT